jgi:hypothetical protein
VPGGEAPFWFILADAVTALGCVLLNIGLGGAALPGVG